MKSASLILIAALCIASLTCSPVGPQAGNTSETTNGEVKGKLSYIDGKAASDVSVFIRPNNHLPTITSGAAKRSEAKIQIDSVKTNFEGVFAFDSIDSGTYAIEGIDHLSNGVFIDSIIVIWNRSTPTPFVEDTLRPLGSVSGTIEIPDTLSHDQVNILIYGIDRSVQPDSNGIFVFDSLPQGTYSLRVSTPGLSTEVVETPTVLAGSSTLLTDTIILANQNTSAPKIVTAQYDTLNGLVKLNWPKLSDATYGYGFKRTGTSSIQLPNSVSSIMDTFYVDTIFSTLTDTNSYALNYLVFSLDQNGNPRESFVPINVSAPSPRLVRTFFAWVRADIIGLNDSMQILVLFSNPTRTLETLSWKIGSIDSTIKQKTISALSGSDTLYTAFNQEGLTPIYFSATDRGGTIWFDTTFITVVNDTPTVFAQGDTTVSINDTFWVYSTGFDQLGSIEKYFYTNSCNAAFLDSSTTGIKSLIAPSTAGLCTILVLAKDEDGNFGFDSLFVNVVQDNPIANAGPDDTVSIKDSVLIQGSGSDLFGRIVQYRIYTNGSNTPTDSSDSSGQFSLIVSSTPGIYPIVLEVEDDDNNLTQDTLLLTVRTAAPVAIITSGNQSVAINDSFAIWVSAADSIGKIIRIRTDILGDSLIDNTLTVDTSFLILQIILKAPSLPGAYSIVFQATDDDNNTSSDTLSLTVQANPPTAFAGNDTTVSINDSFTVNGTGSDSAGTIVKYRFDTNGDGSFDDSSNTSGQKTFAAPSTSGNVSVIFQVVDNDGNTANDTMVVSVLQDSPTVNAGNDTTVSINDTFYIQGTANDSFGSIVRYRFDMNGDGVFDDSSSTKGNDTSTAPSTPGTIIVVLQAEDDDGNKTNDTLIVTVLLDPPSITLDSISMISINDSFTVSGTGSDSFGTIAMYRFDTNGDGTFEDSSTTSGIKTFAGPSTSGTVSVIFQVEDDDKNRVNDTTQLDVRTGRPNADAGTDTTIVYNTTVNFHGSAEDSLGTIILYEWDFDGSLGSFPFLPMNKGDTSAQVASHDFHAYFRVTDDDSNQSIDSVRIKVKPRAVSLTATGDSSGTVRLRWTASPDPDFKWYRVYHQIMGNDSSITLDTTITDVFDTNRTVAGLDTSTTFEFWIITVDTTNLFTPSDTASAAPLSFLEIWNGNVFFANLEPVRTQQSNFQYLMVGSGLKPAPMATTHYFRNRNEFFFHPTFQYYSQYLQIKGGVYSS